MAQGVVDDLEPVEVEVDDADQRGGALKAEKCLTQPVHEHGPVGNAGEGVGERLALQGVLHELAVGDVPDRGHEQDPAAVAGMGNLAEQALGPEVTSVLAPETERCRDRGGGPQGRVPARQDGRQVLRMNVIFGHATDQLSWFPAERRP